MWRGSAGGPAEWEDTTFSFDLRADGDETVVLFANAGWREPVEFMHHCSTAWASYLLSLKHGLEGGKAAPVPAQRARQQLGVSDMADQHIEREVVIDAPADVVWRTITEPDQITRWFADKVELDLRDRRRRHPRVRGQGDHDR